MSDLQAIRLDKSAFSVTTLEAASDKTYWLSCSPYERLWAAELLRQVTYGYDPAIARLEKVLSVETLETLISYRRLRCPHCGEGRELG